MKATICLLVLTFLLFSPSPYRQNYSFWRIAQINNVWWFVSPEGTKHFLTNVTSINYIQESIDGTNFYQSKDFSGNFDIWAEKTAKRVKEYGFTGSGAWSHPAIFKHLAYTKDLNIMAYHLPPISDPTWEKEVEKILIPLLNPTDHNLIGYYTDNELKWDLLEKDAPKYFSTVHRIIKKHDPNHLILGVRFNNRPPISVIKASVGFVDAHSIHVYDNNGKCWKNMFKEIYEITNVPIIVSEFSFISHDNNSGNKNQIWKGGGIVNSQQARADSYKKLVTSLGETSFIIGTEWFQWNDEPPSGRKGDGEDANFGIVDIKDRPYELLIQSIKETANIINDIHSNSNELQLSDMWADDPVREYSKNVHTIIQLNK